MVNVLAQYGISQLDSVDAVRMFVGGLPQHPEPPLNYQIVYSLEGVLDYYTTLSWVLRDGKRQQVRALSEREHVRFGDSVGELEAFHTAGGLSTMPFRYEGKIPTMEYKTLRYPGHAHIMEAIRELGLLSLDPVDVKGTKVVPRDLVVSAIGPKLRKPEGKRPRRASRDRVRHEERGAADAVLGAHRSVRRAARHQRDDADDRLLPIDHRADAGAWARSCRQACIRLTSAFRRSGTSTSSRNVASGSRRAMRAQARSD